MRVAPYLHTGSGGLGVFGRVTVTDGKLWYQDLAPTAADEAGYIVREFARVTKGGVTIGGVRSDHGNGVGFMYAEGQFLAREQYLDEIQEKVQRLGVQV